MKNFLNNNDFQLDEILFENRNKSYGAYALRQESDRILVKAAFIGVAFFAIVAFTPIVINALKMDTPVETFPIPDVIPYDIIDVDESDPAETIPQTQPQQKIEKTIDTRLPTPAKNPTNEKPAVEQSKYDDAIAGFDDIDGDKPITTFKPPKVDVPVGPKTNNLPPAIPQENPNDIIIDVDVKANFIGGINKFREKVGQQFDPYDFDNSGETLRATVTFIVERDGSISHVEATGKDGFFNKEAEKAVKSIKGKWNPAKLNGKPVRSYFKIPLSMRFE